MKLCGLITYSSSGGDDTNPAQNGQRTRETGARRSERRRVPRADAAIDAEVKEQRVEARDGEEKKFPRKEYAAIEPDRLRPGEQRASQKHEPKTGERPRQDLAHHARNRRSPQSESEQPQIHDDNGAGHQQDSDAVQNIQNRIDPDGFTNSDTQRRLMDPLADAKHA